MRRSGKVGLRALVVVAGAILTAVLVGSVFVNWNLFGPGPLVVPKFPLRQFFAQLPSHLRWLVPFSVLTALMVPSRAAQWQRALQRPVPFRERYHLVAIAGFCNNAIPGKLGDVIRSFLLSRARQIPFAESLGSVAVCKLLEFAALMLLAALALVGPFGESMARFAGAMRIAASVCLLLVVLVVVLAHRAKPLAARLRVARRWPKVEMFLLNVGEGLGTARSAKGLFTVLVFSIPPVLFPSIGYGLGLSALGVKDGLFAGPAVLAAIALGQSAIGVPAGAGIYYFVTSWVARSLGATPEQAASYAALTHLGTIFTQLSMGSVSLWASKIKLSTLRKRKDLAAAAVRQEADVEALQAQK